VASVPRAFEAVIAVVLFESASRAFEDRSRRQLASLNSI